jgi:hypothetical protein
MTGAQRPGRRPQGRFREASAPSLARTMSALTTRTSSPTLGVFGRLGRWSARHHRKVFLSWAVLVIVLGALAPRVEHALSGGGWQADGSE